MTDKTQLSFTPQKIGSPSIAMALQARDISIAAARGQVLLHDISFNIDAGELIVLAGYNHSAKSLLIQALAGLHTPVEGQILVDGANLYANRKIFAPHIGCVPARLCLHEQLAVKETLDYEARLRLPRGTTKETRRNRVQNLINLFSLQPVAGRRLSTLTPGERWRTSIAVELLSQPSILLIDAPDERLEASDEIHITSLLQMLASQGLTVIQTTDVARCLQIADHVVMLAADGSLAWFGPADEALTYFKVQSPEGSSLNGSFTFEDVLKMLEAPHLPAGETWDQRFQTSPAYETYVNSPLNGKYPDLVKQDRPLARFRGASKEPTPPVKVPQGSALSLFSLFTSRAFRLLARERMGLFILLAPLLAALTEFLFASPTRLDPSLGDPAEAPIALGLLIFIEMLLAALLFHNEISKERLVYRREGRANTLALPYTFSKIWIVFLAAVYQGLVWSLVHFIASGRAGGVQFIPATWITLALVALIGGLIGLIASALARTANTAILLAVFLTVPQLILSGSVIPNNRLSAPAAALAQANPSRYAFQTLLLLSGYGFDIASDACWQLPESKRNAMSDEQKLTCPCMGDNLFSQCRFPGVHKFFTFIIEQPKPVEPTLDASLNSAPAQPQPQAGQTIEDYAKTVNDYTAQVSQYQAGIVDYQHSVQQYLRDLATWQGARAQVIGNAEGVIRLAIEQYGDSFRINPFSHWGVLLGMSLLLMIALIMIQLKRGISI